MELPPMPRDSEFDSIYAFSTALDAWERVCKAIVDAHRDRVIQHVQVGEVSALRTGNQE